MEYTNEVIERIRATKDQTDYRAIGADLARRWIADVAAYDQIKEIAEQFFRDNKTTEWIAAERPINRSPEIYSAFNEEVRRFWDQHKHDL